MAWVVGAWAAAGKEEEAVVHCRVEKAVQTAEVAPWAVQGATREVGSVAVAREVEVRAVEARVAGTVAATAATAATAEATAAEATAAAPAEATAAEATEAATGGSAQPPRQESPAKAVAASQRSTALRKVEGPKTRVQNASLTVT